MKYPYFLELLGMFESGCPICGLKLTVDDPVEHLFGHLNLAIGRFNSARTQSTTVAVTADSLLGHRECWCGIQFSTYEGTHEFRAHIADITERGESLDQHMALGVLSRMST